MSDDSFLEYVLEQLGEARELKVKRMFGGMGEQHGCERPCRDRSAASGGRAGCAPWTASGAGCGTLRARAGLPAQQEWSGGAGVSASQRDRHV